MSVCSHCEFSNPDGMKYFGKCGYSFEQQSDLLTPGLISAYTFSSTSSTRGCSSISGRDWLTALA